MFVHRLKCNLCLLFISQDTPCLTLRQAGPLAAEGRRLENCDDDTGEGQIHICTTCYEGLAEYFRLTIRSTTP